MVRPSILLPFVILSAVIAVHPKQVSHKGIRHHNRGASGVASSSLLQTRARAGSCPTTYPFAFTLDSTIPFGACCQTAQNSAGTWITANSAAIAGTCYAQASVVCSSPPCQNYGGQHYGTCPSAYPFAYTGTDSIAGSVCCSNPRDASGALMAGSTTTSCYNGASTACPNSPCSNYGLQAYTTSTSTIYPTLAPTGGSTCPADHPYAFTPTTSISGLSAVAASACCATSKDGNGNSFVDASTSTCYQNAAVACVVPPCANYQHQAYALGGGGTTLPVELKINVQVQHGCEGPNCPSSAATQDLAQKVQQLQDSLQQPAATSSCDGCADTNGLKFGVYAVTADETDDGEEPKTRTYDGISTNNKWRIDLKSLQQADKVADMAESAHGVVQNAITSYDKSCGLPKCGNS